MIGVPQEYINKLAVESLIKMAKSFAEFPEEILLAAGLCKVKEQPHETAEEFLNNQNLFVPTDYVFVSASGTVSLIELLEVYAQQFKNTSSTVLEADRPSLIKKIIDEITGQCTCGEMYLSRKLVSPDCVSCNYAEDIADFIICHQMYHTGVQTDDKLKELIEYVETNQNDASIQAVGFQKRELETSALCSESMAMAYKLVKEKATELLNKPTEPGHKEKSISKAFHAISEIPEIKSISITLADTDLYDNVVEAVKQLINQSKS